MNLVGADVNLMFGILALQVDFIGRDQLIEGLHAWALDKSRSLGEILVDQGSLEPEQREPVEMLVQAHLKGSNNDPKKSFATLASAIGVPEELSEIEDGDIELTLSHVGSASASVAILAESVRRVQDKHFGRASSDSGRFERLELHDEGGLGNVWIAKDKELDRKVAIKEMKERFADDESSRRRFVLEAEITGGLEHPGVVPVYGFGTYADGRPFYAMRFIRGKSLKQAIAEFHNKDFSRLRPGAKPVELRRLLGRFLNVCNTVYFAHRRGILHRDIKPNNIMLGEYGETLVVDWGLAKSVDRSKSDEVTDSSLPVEATLMPRSGSSVVKTMMGHAVGSPPYMSPEQARGEQDRLGPATDIYSLGATLYTLLTNERPIDGSTTDEILRRVRCGEWRKPRSLNGDIPRPLEAICIKAMAIRPEDRYPSVRRLVREIEQYLADEPVSAHRESMIERVRRLGRRHRSLVVAGLASLFLVTLISLAATILVNGQRMKAESLAEQKAKLALDATDAKEDALTRQKEAEAAKLRSDRIRHFLVEIIHSAKPEKKGAQVTVVQLLDSVDRIDERFADDPLLGSEMLRVVGETYLSLAKISTSVDYAEKSYRMSLGAVGAEQANTLDSQHFLAKAYLASGQREKSLQHSLEHYKLRVKVNGNASLETLAAKQTLAEAYLGGSAEETRKALNLLRNVHDQRRQSLGDDHIQTMYTSTSLANVLIQAEQFEEAVKLAMEAYRIQSQLLGIDHPLTLRTMTIAASAMEYSGNVEQAIVMHEAAVDAKRAKFGDAHMETVLSEFALALAYIDSGRAADARRLITHLNSHTDQLRATAGQANTLPYKIAALSLLDSYNLLPVLEGRTDTLRTIGSVSTSLPLAQNVILGLVLRQRIKGFFTGNNRLLMEELAKVFVSDSALPKGALPKGALPKGALPKGAGSSAADDVLSNERTQNLGDDD
jgi:serine/threonine protein kinase